MADESIFQHDGKPCRFDTATDAILQTGIYDKELRICLEDAAKVLLAKAVQYGNSWKRRGGIGAFMIFARKWDRIELQAERYGYQIFRAIDADYGKPDGLLDDIRDLRNYLTLVEHEVRKAHGDFQGRDGNVHERNAATDANSGGDDSSRIRDTVPVHERK